MLQSIWRRKAEIYAVLIWHFHSQARVYAMLWCRSPMTPRFKSGVTTVFNSDFSTHLAFGAGKNCWNYVENLPGKLIDAKGSEGTLCSSRRHVLKDILEPNNIAIKVLSYKRSLRTVEVAALVAEPSAPAHRRLSLDVSSHEF